MVTSLFSFLISAASSAVKDAAHLSPTNVVDRHLLLSSRSLKHVPLVCSFSLTRINSFCGHNKYSYFILYTVCVCVFEERVCVCETDR